MANLSERDRQREPVVRLQLFGVIEAWTYAGENVLPRGRKAQAIVSYLALTPEHSVPRKRLTELLWSTRGVEQARASLRQSLIEIRTMFAGKCEDLITIERDHVRIHRELVWVDGLTGRADAGAIEPEPPATGPGELLETLIGLDPKYDEWIRAVRASFVSRLLLPDQPAGDAARLFERAGRPSVVEASSAQRRQGRHRQVIASLNAQADSVPRQRRLMVSVVPFRNLQGGDIDDHVLPAITQEIATALARFRWIQVRIGHSTDDYGSDYKLDGYIGRVSSERRLVARLIDQSEQDIIVWTCSEVLDTSWRESTVGDIAQRVVEQLDPEILAIETRKVLRKPAASRDAYGCVMRAISALYRFDEPGWQEATAYLLDATGLDPDYGRAFAFSALCRITGVAQGWAGAPGHEIAQADKEAAQAIACDPHDSLALALSAHIASFARHDFGGALKLFDRAIRANPSCGFSWAYSSLTFAYLGEIEEARRRLGRSREVMIHDPFSSFLEAFNVVILYFSSAWLETVVNCRRALQLRPGMSNIRKYLISALCFLERYDEAAREQEELTRLEPDFTWTSYLVRYPFGRSQDRVALEAVLRKAQLIEAGRRSLRPAVEAPTSAPVVALRATRRSK